MDTNTILLGIFWILIVVYWLSCLEVVNTGRFGSFIPAILFTVLGVLLLPMLHLSMHLSK